MLDVENHGGWGLHDAAFGVAVVDRGVVPRSAESKLVVHRKVLCAHRGEGGRAMRVQVDLLAKRSAAADVAQASVARDLGWG